MTTGPGLFKVGRSDAGACALLSVHLFLTVASTVIGKAARDALFLSRFTALQMTAVDLITMTAVALVVAAQLRLNVQIPMRRLLVISPLCFALGDVVLWVGLSSSHGGWITWVAYLWIGIQASFGTPHASVLANHLLTIRQAKRVCGLVGAGAILGWIGGGLITSGLAAHWGVSSLLLGAGMLTALCPLVVSVAWREGADGAAEATAGGHAPAACSLRQSASLVWTSPHLRAIATLALVSSAVTTIAGLQFKVIASQSIQAADQLAAFFGSFSLQAGLVALVTQLLLTSRMMGRFGIGPTLAIAPAALAAGSLGVLCSGTLATAVLMKGSDQVLRYSIDRTAVESLYRPLPPREIFEGKTFIDALVSRCGDAAGATIALVGVVLLHLSFRSLTLITIAMIVGWFASAEIARRRYRARLLERIEHRPRRPGRPTSRRPALATRVRARIARRRGPDPRGVLDPDPGTRLQVLRALTRSLDRRAPAVCDDTLFSTALGAEIVGFAMLVESRPPCGQSWAEHRLEGLEAIERISRLLFLINPDRYPGCVLSALRCGNAAIEAAALEYLDTTLASPYRQLLMSLLDRWTLAAA